MTYPQNNSSLLIAFAAYRPTQIAFVAGVFSLLLHIWGWHIGHSNAFKTKPVIVSQRIEALLMSKEPKQPVPIIQPEPKPEPEPPKPKIIEKPKPKVIPKIVPTVKPLPKPIVPKPLPKNEVLPEPPKAIPKTKEPNPGGHAGGYGIASKTGQGTGTSIGLGGGFGNGTGGGFGTGTGSGRGTGSATDNDKDESTGLTKGVVVLEKVRPEYPPRAMMRRIEGRVTVEFIIRPNGEIANPTVVSAEPSDIFNEAALTAIKKWKFKQKIVNGVAIEQRTRQIISFTLKKS